jgi:hypothetical protein
MTSYASTRIIRGPAPRRPLGNLVTGLAALVVAGGIWVLGARTQRDPGFLIHSIARLGGAHAAGDGAHLQAFLAEARLSPAEARAMRTALADARESRRAAIAYFEGLYEDDGARRAAIEHAAEIDELVDGAVREKLAEALGPARVEMASRHFVRLSDLLAAAPGQ